MGLARTRSLALGLAVLNGLLAIAVAQVWNEHRQDWQGWCVRTQAAQTLRASTLEQLQRGELD